MLSNIIGYRVLLELVDSNLFLQFTLEYEKSFILILVLWT